MFYDIRVTEVKDLVFEGLLRSEDPSPQVYIRAQETLEDLPGSGVLYYLPQSVEKLFSTYPPLDLASFERAHGDSKWNEQVAFVRQGLIPGNYDLFVRYRWEVAEHGIGRKWFTFAKGGDFARYYSDIEHVLLWENGGQVMKEYARNRYGSASRTIKNERYFFREGLTYPRVSSRGLNVRYLPDGHVFSDTGMAIFPGSSKTDVSYLLGLLNSVLSDFIVNALHPGRKYEILHLSSVPYRQPTAETSKTISSLAKSACELKATWDTGNETCTRFDAPWLVQAHRGTLLAGTTAELEIPNIQSPIPNTQSLLNYVRTVETAADARLQRLQSQIDEAVYDLYEITPEDRALIERELGDRPPELVWPQMERKLDKEKRREHVRRLVSCFLLQALKEKRDGILPLAPGAGQTTALDEIRRRMEAEFGEEAAFRMETEIKQVLGRGIADWLNGPFFKWHTKLYKKRPIIWHLASPRSTFACFVHYHKLDRDTLRKVQTLYLWPRRRAVETELEAARAAKAAGERGAARRIDQAEAILDDLAELEKRLLAVIQGEVECDTPEWAEGPYRSGVYDPVLDDGVKVNIAPLQEAGILRYKGLV